MFSFFYNLAYNIIVVDIGGIFIVDIGGIFIVKIGNTVEFIYSAVDISLYVQSWLFEYFLTTSIWLFLPISSPSPSTTVAVLVQEYHLAVAGTRMFVYL